MSALLCWSVRPGAQPIGASADRLYGCERFILQSAFRHGGIRRRGSADDLVGLEEEGRGNGQAQRLGGLQVDDQLEGRELLHREVGGLRAFQDSIHIVGPIPTTEL
jgi:hypothetical protein